MTSPYAVAARKVFAIKSKFTRNSYKVVPTRGAQDLVARIGSPAVNAVPRTPRIVPVPQFLRDLVVKATEHLL